MNDGKSIPINPLSANSLYCLGCGWKGPVRECRFDPQPIPTGNDPCADPPVYDAFVRCPKCDTGFIIVRGLVMVSEQVRVNR